MQRNSSESLIFSFEGLCSVSSALPDTAGQECRRKVRAALVVFSVFGPCSHPFFLRYNMFSLCLFFLASQKLSTINKGLLAAPHDVFCPHYSSPPKQPFCSDICCARFLFLASLSSETCFVGLLGCPWQKITYTTTVIFDRVMWRKIFGAKWVGQRKNWNILRKNIWKIPSGRGQGKI